MLVKIELSTLWYRLRVSTCRKLIGIIRKVFYCPLLTVKKIAHNGISVERSNFKRHFLETNKVWVGPLYLKRAHLYLSSELHLLLV